MSNYSCGNWSLRTNELKCKCKQPNPNLGLWKLHSLDFESKPEALLSDSFYTDQKSILENGP